MAPMPAQPVEWAPAPPPPAGADHWSPADPTAAAPAGAPAPGTEWTILSQPLPRNAGTLTLTNTRLIQVGAGGMTQLELPLAEVSYVVSYGIGSVQITMRSGQVHRISVGPRQMMKWRTAIGQAVAGG